MYKISSLLIFMLVCFSNIKAQEATTNLTKGTDGLYSYEKVFEVPGKTKEEIYETLKSWVVKNNKDQSNTNYFNEKDKDNISTTLSFAWSTWTPPSTYDFKLNFDIKEGKYRLSATSFVSHNVDAPNTNLGTSPALGYTKKQMRLLVDYVDENFGKMLTSIQNSFTKKSDW